MLEHLDGLPQPEDTFLSRREGSMWQDKRVSVVFPAYHEAQHIGRAIQGFRDVGEPPGQSC